MEHPAIEQIRYLDWACFGPRNRTRKDVYTIDCTGSAQHDVYVGPARRREEYQVWYGTAERAQTLFSDVYESIRTADESSYPGMDSVEEITLCYGPLHTEVFRGHPLGVKGDAVQLIRDFLAEIASVA